MKLKVGFKFIRLPSFKAAVSRKYDAALLFEKGTEDFLSFPTFEPFFSSVHSSFLKKAAARSSERLVLT